VTASTYGQDFFEELGEGSSASARAVMPLLIEAFAPQSMIDVGCGRGAWLAAARELGVSDVLGVDGAYVDVASLLIPAERFTPHDLTTPLRIARRFDVALSLEVGEHLIEAVAPTFVESLVAAAPVVVLTAPVPNQPGTQHLNGQWPEYWAQLFRSRGYVAFDPFRLRLWDDRRVEYWYAQNMVVFVSADRLQGEEWLGAALGGARDPLPAYVHPALYRQVTDIGVRGLWVMLRRRLRELALRRLRRPFRRSP
jgi:hypothetical protein